MSAPRRCAERHARRTSRCARGVGLISASRRSPTAWLAALSARRSSRCPQWFLDQALGLDLLRHLSQRNLAESGQVLDAEEVVECGVDPLGRVDLAVAQAVQERLGGEVHEDDLVGVIEHRIRHRLPNADPGQLADTVVEALEVLHVDRRVDVDAGGENIRDILVALLVLEARSIRVRELIDQREVGRPGDDGREGPSPPGRCRGSPPRRRGTNSRPLACSIVSFRPCGSRYPMTTSRPSLASARPSWSMRYVFPTPAAIPRNTLRLPRSTSISTGLPLPALRMLGHPHQVSSRPSSASRIASTSPRSWPARCGA